MADPQEGSLERAFDARADSYARSDWHVAYAERLVELAELPPGARVLDAATGTGLAARAAARGVGPGGRVAAGLFRRQAAEFGLDLADPSAPLGTRERCAQVLRSAGFTPERIVTETVRFSPADLDGAWEAHARGPHHDALAALPPGRAEKFRRKYTDALDELRRSNGERARTAEVLYTFGRRNRPAGMTKGPVGES